MLEGIKRWLSRRPASLPGRETVAPWAESRQWSFRDVRDRDGFVVEGRFGEQAWRLEWGPPQRPYIEGPELRLRAEIASLPPDLQALVVDRALQERLERQMFDEYVEQVQTRIDERTPPEMRWLVMFPRLGAAESGALRERFVALASAKPWLLDWLRGPLAPALLALPAATSPFVLSVSRGRLTLRTALAEPDAPELEPWLKLFQVATSEARRAASAAFGGARE